MKTPRLAAITAALFALTPLVLALDIPLVVKEPARVARKAAPVTSGIPFPHGVLPASQAFVLLDGEKPIPLQTTPISVDLEGKLRWLLLDFQIDVGGGEQKNLVLRSTASAVNPAPPKPVRVTDGPDAVEVSTGPLSFRVSKGRPFELLEAVEVEGRRIVERGAVDFVEGKSGSRYVAGAPARVDLEYAGALRVTLRVEGIYVPEGQSLRLGEYAPGYITRITAWAGSTAVRIEHILSNSNPGQVDHWNFRSAALRLHAAVGDGVEVAMGTGTRGDGSAGGAGGGDGGAGVAGGDGGADAVGGDGVATGTAWLRLPAGESAWLHQGKVNRYYGEPIRDAARSGIGDRTTWTGAEPEGWIALHGAAGSIVVCDRDFVGDPPRRLEAGSGGITAEYVSARFSGGKGVPFESENLWLYDLSHRSADIWIDFGATTDTKKPEADAARVDAAASTGRVDPAVSTARAAPAVPTSLAASARSRLLAFATPDWYSQCDVLGVGRFGTLEDEKAAYAKWGWKYDEKQLPRSAHSPGEFVRWEDNHYESEADSPEALVLMALRTGQRGFFDLAEAWARYHASLHAWRTDGWIYDDGAIWFPQGGPLGTKPARKPSPIQYRAWGEGSGDDKELWHLAQGKACYCHFYGAGLIDHFCLTGNRDSLEAALDLVEQKASEFVKHRRLEPGKTTIDDTRGFGRGFYVLDRVLDAVPQNRMTVDLARLCRDVLWRDPNLDERGFAPCHIGTGFGGFDPKKDIPKEMAAFLDEESIRMDENGWLTDRAAKRWPVVCLGGTWQHAYVQAAAYRYWQLTGDEDMGDFAEAFGRFAAKHLLSDKCKQVHYYAYMDVPTKGEAWDPWKFEAAHAATVDGVGCKHEGWYTRFFPDAVFMAYEISGDRPLLERAREFWHYGSKRGYQTTDYSAGKDAVGEFAGHQPPKDDTVLSTSRMFHAWAHSRSDGDAPEPIHDLKVTRLVGGEGKAIVRFTAPADRGGGRVVRYQVKCAELLIVAWDDFDFARDDGKRRNYWRATNLQGEPAPSSPGMMEEFTVSGLPHIVSGEPNGGRLHFVVTAVDDSGNRSALSNIVDSM